MRELLKESAFIKLHTNQVLYKESDHKETMYILLHGMVVLHSDKMGAIGLVKMGDLIGEESLVFED